MSLSIKNQLKTTLTIGNAGNLGKKNLPYDSEGIFASWCHKLNKQPVTDLFRKEPLNKVKLPDNDNIQGLLLEAEHKNWLEDVDNRMKKLGF